MILDDGSERHVHRVALEARRTKERERLGPLDGLGDAGPLDEVERPDLLDGGRDPARKLARDGRCPRGADLDLEIGRRIGDAVVETTPPKSI